MTDEDLRMAADWLARDGANCQLHIDIADEIKKRLALTRPTSIGDMPVSVDGIDRMDLSISRLSQAVKSRDAEIDRLNGVLSNAIGRSVEGVLVRVENGGWRMRIGNETTLLTYRVNVPLGELMVSRRSDYSTATIRPREIDRD